MDVRRAGAVDTRQQGPEAEAAVRRGRRLAVPLEQRVAGFEIGITRVQIDTACVGLPDLDHDIDEGTAAGGPGKPRRQLQEIRDLFPEPVDLVPFGIVEGLCAPTGRRPAEDPSPNQNLLGESQPEAVLEDDPWKQPLM